MIARPSSVFCLATPPSVSSCPSLRGPFLEKSIRSALGSKENRSAGRTLLFRSTLPSHPAGRPFRSLAESQRLTAMQDILTSRSMKVSFPEFVAINERKRRVELRRRMICSSWPAQNRSRKRTRRSSGFVCGTVAKPVGSNAAVARSAKSRVLKRINKNDSVLHKHQKWLQQLQEKRRQVEERKRADAERQLVRRKAFMEREAKKRLDKRNKEPLVAKTNAPSTPETVPTEDDDDSDGSTSISSSSAESGSRTAESGARARPAWCQTEKDREACEEAAKLEEECRLLDFVDSLDFDQYSEDLELQTLIGQVKRRIKAIELENKKDATKLQTCVDVSSVLECVSYMVVLSLTRLTAALLCALGPPERERRPPCGGAGRHAHRGHAASAARPRRARGRVRRRHVCRRKRLEPVDHRFHSQQEISVRAGIKGKGANRDAADRRGRPRGLRPAAGLQHGPGRRRSEVDREERCLEVTIPPAKSERTLNFVDILCVNIPANIFIVALFVRLPSFSDRRKVT